MPALAQGACRQGRAAVGLAVPHVEFVHELVNHHVVALGRRVARCGHVFPAQRHRAQGHGFAGEFLGVAVHHAVLVGDFAARQHRARVDHDAFEVLIPVQPQVQHRQAGLRGNRHGHGVSDLQSMRA